MSENSSAPGNQAILDAFAAALASEFRDARKLIQHCLDQLDESQWWERPSDSMNSIANLLLHLSGNVRQWIIAGVGGEPDRRDRPAEFSARQMSNREVLQQLDTTIEEALQVLGTLSAENLLSPRRVQGFTVTGMEAIVQSVAHFRGHTQEIVHMTRSQLGDAYRYNFVPATPGQGGA